MLELSGFFDLGWGDREHYKSMYIGEIERW